jgi:hypothetical protein
MGYNSIEFPDGEEKRIQEYNLEHSESVDGKYVVVPYFSTGEKIDAVSLVKIIRMQVVELANKLNDE